LVQRNSYAIEVDNNCYTCGGFWHIAQHCRNREQRGRPMDGKRLEYRGRRERNYKHSDNLKEKENLESLN